MPDQHQLTEPREQESGWTVARGLTKRKQSMTVAVACPSARNFGTRPTWHSASSISTAFFRRRRWHGTLLSNAWLLWVGKVTWACDLFHLTSYLSADSRHQVRSTGAPSVERRSTSAAFHDFMLCKHCGIMTLFIFWWSHFVTTALQLRACLRSCSQWYHDFGQFVIFVFICRSSASRRHIVKRTPTCSLCHCGPWYHASDNFALSLKSCYHDRGNCMIFVRCWYIIFLIDKCSLWSVVSRPWKFQLSRHWSWLLWLKLCFIHSTIPVEVQ